MPPQQRFVQVMSAALMAVALLTACRKEVPPPPLPKPEKTPKPTVAAVAVGAIWRVG